jgi:tetratricopeptide (TPR) repeat protein
MSEGHEHLEEGEDLLLRLHTLIPEEAKVVMVTRRGQGQRWCFPWLFRNLAAIRYTRAKHNTLEFPSSMFHVKLPTIITYHDRAHDRTKKRAIQRRGQNRKSLCEDWLSRGSEHSLFYLAQEWRGYNDSKSEERFLQFMAKSNNGCQRYQARLILACMYRNQNRLKDAREILINAVVDDWSRSEHWLWLGDIEFQEKNLETAYVYYRYAATMVGSYPFTLWWIDENHYSYLPPQRLTMLCGELGKYNEGLQWAKHVVELLPKDAPEELVSEAQNIVKLFEEATQNGSNQTNN